MENGLAEWIVKAVSAVESGFADKLTRDNVTVYRVKNIVRIDVNVGR